MNLKIRRKLESDKDLNLGIQYPYEGKTFKLDEIFDWAMKGKVGAVATLSSLYFNGKILSEDKSLAIEMLESLIARHPDVPYGIYLNLGSYYFKMQSYEKAIALYNQLERLKYAPAISRLAMHYNKGFGVDIDLSASLEKLKLASELGHVRSKNLLAMHYIKHGSINMKCKGFIQFLLNLFPTLYCLVFNKNDEYQLL